MTKIKETRAVIDIETGGFGTNAGVVEIAILVIDENFKHLAKYSAIVQPYFQEDSEEPMLYHYSAQKVHGISVKAQEKKGLQPRQIVKEIEDIIQVFTVTEFIGHNAEKFDCPKMAEFFNRFSSYQITNPFYECEVIDTMKLAREFLDLQRYNLKSCCEYYGIINQDAHRALGDVMATAELLEKLEQ